MSSGMALLGLSAGQTQGLPLLSKTIFSLFFFFKISQARKDAPSLGADTTSGLTIGLKP